MIKFALKCAAGHAFDSWFASGSAYEKLVAAGEVVCPACGSTDVQKDVMAPAVGRSTKGRDVETYASGLGDAANADPRARLLLEAAKRIRAHLESEGQYVGRDFAKAARARFEGAEDDVTSGEAGEDVERPLWGEATTAEARELIEDGIPILPVPKLPEDAN